VTAIGNTGTGNPTAKFSGIGDTISGTIFSAVDVQERDFRTKTPKTFSDGNPILQVRVTLERPSGKVDFYVTGKNMKAAVREAVVAAGASDLEPMAFLSVTRSGGRGEAGDPYTYTAKYVPFDPTA
jgi:hypothetical protein